MGIDTDGYIFGKPEESIKETNVISKESSSSKSIKELIKKIESLNPVDYGSMSSYEAHNAAREVKYDILNIIEEYFEVE